jgi:hypothetical protein
MIAANVVQELREISDPAVASACATFIHAARQIADANDPRLSGNGGRHGGKAGSRGPGRQQCPGAVEKLCRIARDAANVWGNLAPRLERHDDPIETMGTIRVTVEDGKLVGRRKDGTFDGTPRGPRPPHLCQGV